jgi:cathepsin A (carboxypeptidase C)
VHFAQGQGRSMPEPCCGLLQVSPSTGPTLSALSHNRSGSRFACVPANLYCYSGVFGGLQELGLNMYDVRKKCDKAEDKDGPVRQITSSLIHEVR